MSGPAGQCIQSAHGLWSLLHSESSTRALTGRTRKPGNPQLQIRHFGMFLNNLAHLRPDLITNDGAAQCTRARGGIQVSDGTIIAAPSLQCWFHPQHSLAQTPASQLSTICEIYKAAYIWGFYCFNFAVAVSSGFPFFQ